MKKIKLCLLSLALLASQASFAGPDKDSISKQCQSVVLRLKMMVDSKRSDICAGDVAIAGAHLMAANMKIDRYKFEEALVSMHQGERELHEIAYSRNYCSYFAPFIKTELARVIEIIGELDVLKRTKT